MTRASPALGSRRASRRVAAVGALLATALAYAPGLRAPLTYDDPFLIERSPVVTGARPLADAFSSGYWEGIAAHRGNEYRPLTVASLAVEHRWFGARAWPYRLVNLGLHLLCAVLVGRLARRLGATDVAALLAQALFALHPLHVEAVTGIVGRGELLSTVLTVACVLAFLTPGVGAALAWVVLACAGLLAKESAAVAPLLAAGTAAWLASRGEWPPRPAWHALAFAPVLIGYAALRAAVVGSFAGEALVSPIENPLVEAPFLGRALAGAELLARYAALHAFPVRLSADYGFDCIPVPRGLEVRAALAVLCWLALAAGALRHRRSLASWVLLWFLLALAVASNVALPIGTIFGERLAYLASVGVTVGAGSALARALAARPRQAAPLILGLLGLLAVRTAERNVDFASAERLFASAVEVCPRSVKARKNLAAFEAQRGDPRAALANIEAALVVRPDWAPARADRGRLLWEGGDRLGARADFDAAHVLDPHNSTALAGLGDVAVAEGDCWRAVPLYREALLADPGDRYARAGVERCGALLAP